MSISSTQVELQQARNRLQTVRILALQARMIARGTGAMGTGPLGATKGANLIVAAGGAANVQSNLVLQLAAQEAQKLIMAQIRQLKAVAKTEEVLKQIRAKVAELRHQQEQMVQLRDTARGLVGDMADIVRILQF
jgi:hypothetical protein